MSVPSNGHVINRRDFLMKCGWISAGVTVLSSCNSIMIALPSTTDPELEDSLSWIQVMPGGKIRFFCPRMEMGQATSLGLTQVVAEELNIGPQEIECVLPDTNQTPAFKMTVGSEGIFEFFRPVSYGAARMREVLRLLAAEKSGFPTDQITEDHRGFILPDGAKLDYGALVPSEPMIISADASEKLDKEPRQYAFKRIGEYNAIGNSWKHPELEAIVTGRAVYSRDTNLENMLYGQVVRPPAFGAKLKSANGRTAEAMSHTVSVIINMDDNFVGVVSSDPFLLSNAINALDVQWELPESLNQEQIDAQLNVKRLRANDDFEHTLKNSGDISMGRRAAKHRATVHYGTPFALHAAMEPRAGLAWVKEKRVEIWCGCQDPFFVQKRVAKAIGRNVGDVVVHTHRMGGGFGGRVPCQASEEAAILSAAVGQPVRVQWDRETECQNNYFQPGFSHFIDAGVTADGLLSHWQHDFVSSPIITGLVPRNIAWILDKMMADEGTARGSVHQYRVVNMRVRYADIRTDVPIGAWRGLGAAPNTFAIESMMDELATTARLDPLEFRLKNLPPTSNRLARVLYRVAQMSDCYQGALKDQGRGLACAVYKGQTAVAIVAEVKIDHAAKEVCINRIWCAQDCGLVINPSQVENQIMGNIVWGCSVALKERITITAGEVEESNFDTYEILRHDETPIMTVALIDAPEHPPVAVGESAFGPVAPAIANAVFAATGRRVRNLPISYDSLFSNVDA
jgi:isoquinoline 1-oxidoreductase subunit beta